jgi:F420-0:gamma-glutamyl ligase
MTLNPEDYGNTIADIHRTRRHIAETFGNDLAAIVEDARKRAARSGHEI